MLIDTHCHIFKEYYDNIDFIIENAMNNGIKMIIVNGFDDESNKQVLNLIKKYDIVYGALGIQPEEVEKCNDNSLEFIENHINDEKIVAVGEIGLDYHYECDKDKQLYYFKKQLEIANRYNKPVIVHSRDCIQETYNILKMYSINGIMHCYSGSLEMAREFCKLGFKLGVGGICTFKNAKNIINVINNVDLEYIVLETDSPYLSPEPFRGSKNEPANLIYIAKKICELKSISFDELCSVTTGNVLHLFDKYIKM